MKEREREGDRKMKDRESERERLGDRGRERGILHTNHLCQRGLSACWPNTANLIRAKSSRDQDVGTPQPEPAQLQIPPSRPQWLKLETGKLERVTGAKMLAPPRRWTADLHSEQSLAGIPVPRQT